MTTPEIVNAIHREFGTKHGEFYFQSEDGKIDVYGRHEYFCAPDPVGEGMEPTFSGYSDFTITSVYLAVEDELVESVELMEELMNLL